ncbi:MAG: S8 family peptidase [Acidimicrobiales bacterium]
MTLVAALGTTSASADTSVNSETVELVIVEEAADGSLSIRTVPTTAANEIQIMAASRPDSTIISVEPQIEVRAFPNADTDPIGATGTNDARRGSQWALDRINFESTWQTASGTGIVVAVLDTGVLGTHEDLVGRLLPGADFVSGGGDGTLADHPHGSHVSGIIGATADNIVGVAGGSPNVRILPVRVLNSNGSGSVSGVWNGIIWAIDNGADIINLSLGTATDSSTLRTAVAYAESHGVLVIAAAGNDGLGSNSATYPAAIDEVVAVSATTAGDTRASYSNHGTWIDIAAPGSGIWSLANSSDNAYASMSGTSMASPYVAATAALVLSAAPTLTPAQVRAALYSSAEDLGATGEDDDFGAGLIDPLAAVESVAEAAPEADPPPPPDPPPAETPLADASYSLLTSTGRIIAPGEAGAAQVGLSLNQPIVGGATTPSGLGAWLVASDGGVFSYGDAQYFGSTGHLRLNRPIVGMASTPSGNGYWLVASDGGIFTFGDATYYGSTGSIHLNQPITGMAPTRTGDGYWLVASDGGIFTFGDAPFMGSAAGQLEPGELVVGMIEDES